MQLVDGPRRVLEGPPSSHVADYQGVTFVELRAHSSVGTQVWSAQPDALRASACGRLLPFSGIELTFGAPTYYVKVFSSSSRGARPSVGTCSRISTIDAYDPDN